MNPAPSRTTCAVFAGGSAAVLLSMMIAKRRRQFVDGARVPAAGADGRVHEGLETAAATLASVEDSGRIFKFYPEDFGELTVAPLHLDLMFDVTEERVRVITRTTFEVRGGAAITSVQLDCNSLEIVRVAAVTAGVALGGVTGRNFVEHVASFEEGGALEYEYDTANNSLTVQLGRSVAAGAEFTILTETVATPTDHILEGLYFDYTPEGQPRTIITQCQQYGFQRIVPAVDAMNAKAFYTTTILADKRYTNIITNGDLAPGFFDETGAAVYAPSPVAGDSARHLVTYHNHVINMASYLFFLGVGTYVTYRRHLEFAEGTTCLLELLVFPGLVEPEHAHAALDDLHDSVQWVHLSTGAEACEHEAERAELYELLAEREQLKALIAPLITSTDTAPPPPQKLSKAQKKRLEAIRARMAVLMSAWTRQGYLYTGQIYREIAMERSQYGGMENTGNTTIISSVLTPSKFLADNAYVYMVGVKAHEYYHNINGSECTGHSPFQIWLNEAATVHFERQRVSVVFGDDFVRLRQILYAFTPATGPLAQDRSPNSMAIMPVGFNSTEELISAMTYSKAPEYVRMVELLVGKANFSVGLANYHADFKFGNATEMDWVVAMERASGLELQSMATKWLKRTGYPSVSVSGTYDSARRTYTVAMQQTGWDDEAEVTGPWDFPVDWALVSGGAVTHEGVYRFSTAAATFEVTGVDSAPDFLSFARCWSYFGDYTVTTADQAALECQARTDPDAVNRYFAYRAIADGHKAAIVAEASSSGSVSYAVPASFADLHAAILFDEALSPSSRALLLHENEGVSTRPDLCWRYAEISDARTALLQAVWDRHGARVLALYQQVAAADCAGPHRDGLHERALKRHLFEIIWCGCSSSKRSVLARQPVAEVAALTVDVDALAVAMLRSSHFMSDRIFALSKVLASQSPEREAVDAETRAEWAKHPISWEEYIRVVAGLDADDAPQRIRSLLDHPDFDINHPGHARTVARGWGAIRKRSLLTQPGLELTADLFLRIAVVNQMSAGALLSAFDDLGKFSGEQKAALVAALQRMKAGVDPTEHRQVYGRLVKLLSQ